MLRSFFEKQFGRDWLEKIAPHEPVSCYRQNVGEDNADTNMKRQVIGREVVVAITNGQLDFNTGEQIYMVNLMDVGANG